MFATSGDEALDQLIFDAFDAYDVAERSVRAAEQLQNVMRVSLVRARAELVRAVDSVRKLDVPEGDDARQRHKDQLLRWGAQVVEGLSAAGSIVDRATEGSPLTRALRQLELAVVPPEGFGKEDGE